MINLLIENLQLTPVRAQNGLTFFASFTLENAFQMSNIAVYTRPDGRSFRCVYPVKKLLNGSLVPLYYPISKAVGSYIEHLITNEANRLLLSK